MGKDLVSTGIIEGKIFLIRGHRVIIDRDIAELYGVETKYLNRQVKRNIQRFPKEFMFRLNVSEKNELVTICHRLNPVKHSSAAPFAFTEHGVAMLASILNSERAVKVSINIIKAFIKLRKTMFKYKELFSKLKMLKNRVDQHDIEIRAIFEAIQQLIEPSLEEKPKRQIGFHHD